MESYKNLSGSSSVVGFEIGADYIKVQFNDGSVYLYNNQSTGEDNIVKMKALAIMGEGLKRFIMRRVRKAYAAKLS